MKAIIIPEHGDSSVLQLADIAIPVISNDQIRIKVEKTSVNFADIKARQGAYGKRDLPFIPGLDAVGIVDAVGEDITEFKVGDRVAAYTLNGSYAEYALTNQKLCFVLPDSVSFDQGVGIGILITANNVLTLAGRFVAGERVLVHSAAGGVGSTLVQLAKGLGASEVFATVGSAEKADVAKRLGADHVINYREESFDEVVNSLTDDKGVDLILDAVSGENAERGMQCLAPFGRLVIYGHTGSGSASIDSKLLHSFNRGVIGYSSGGFRKARPEVIKEAGKRVMALLEEGKVDVLLGERFKLEDAFKAQELVEGRKSVGKVVLELS